MIIVRHTTLWMEMSLKAHGQETVLLTHLNSRIPEAIKFFLTGVPHGFVLSAAWKDYRIDIYLLLKGKFVLPKVLLAKFEGFQSINFSG